jgi:tRNA nucleotidyltransferase (CCA-adding enzyme)
MMDRTHLADRLRTHPVLSRISAHLDGRVSVVGGLVRDALVGVTHLHDVDLVVEGDAIAVAQRVGQRLGSAVIVHERFGTAVVELPHGGGHVDFISARRERYAHPGALPEVIPGTLADDLARRDFTINAIAVRIAGPDAGEVVDPHDGIADLRAGTVRSLRAGAFVEDPSRIVRAGRYAGRLGFSVEATTASEIGAAIGTLDWGSARAADELRRLLEEADPGPALALLFGFGAPGIAPDASARIVLLDTARDELADRDPHAALPARWALRAGVALEAPARETAALPGWARGAAAEVADGARLRDQLARVSLPSEVDGLLAHTPVAAQIGALASGASQVGMWWARWRGVQTAVRGSDLIAAGIAPGPEIGRALAELRAAVLDGRVAGADDQLAFAIAAARVDDR